MVFNPSNTILLNYLCCECKYFQINQIVENNCVVLVEYYGSLHWISYDSFHLYCKVWPTNCSQGRAGTINNLGARETSERGHGWGISSQLCFRKLRDKR